MIRSFFVAKIILALNDEM